MGIMQKERLPVGRGATREQGREVEDVYVLLWPDRQAGQGQERRIEVGPDHCHLANRPRLRRTWSTNNQGYTNTSLIEPSLAGTQGLVRSRPRSCFCRKAAVV